MYSKTIIVGYLGNDPVVRYTPAGTAVANFRMASSFKWKDKAGELQTRTEWHNIVAWRRLGEVCGEYLSKGKLILIEGRSEQRKWIGRDGDTRYTTEIVISEMRMLGKAPENDPAAKREDREVPPPSEEPISIPDDDIPF